MTCPFCNSPTKIYNSRSTHGKTQTWRRHICTTCERVFTTRERVDWTGVTTVKTSKDTTGYSKERLLLSIARASNNLSIQPAMLAELCDSTEQQLQQNGFFNEPEQDADLITAAATMVLHRYNPNLALQYVNIVYSNNPPLELVKQLLSPLDSL